MPGKPPVLAAKAFKMIMMTHFYSITDVNKGCLLDSLPEKIMQNLYLLFHHHPFM